MNKRIAFIDYIKPVRTETTELEAPLAFLFLSHAARSAGYETRFFLFRQDDRHLEDLVDEILAFDPRVLAFNGTFGVFAPDSVELARKLKKKSGHAVTIFGGISCTVSPQAYLEDPAVDYVCLGEGEKVFVDFCRAVCHDLEPKEIPGIYNRDDLGRRPFEAQVIADLSQVDLDMDLIDWNLYTRKRGDTVTLYSLQSSRGCPFSCSFCYRSSVPCKYRVFPEEKLLNWVKYLKDRIDFQYISFIDDHFFVNKRHCISLVKKIYEMGIKLTRLDIRMEDISDELFSLVDRYEVGGLFVGLESPIDDVLDRMNKKTSRRMIDQALDVVRRWPRVQVLAQLMLGVPRMNARELMETIRFAADRLQDTPNLRLGFVPYIPLPGTRFTQEIVSNWPHYQMDGLDDIAELSTSGRFDLEWTDLTPELKNKMYDVRGLFFLYDLFYRQSFREDFPGWFRYGLRTYAAFLKKRLLLLKLTGSTLERKTISLLARRPVGYV